MLACRPAALPALSLDPNADVVVPYPTDGGGIVTFTVHSRYRSGAPITFTLDVSAGGERIRGPLSGRVLASGLDGEKIVRIFGPSTLEAVDVAAYASAHARITWDGRDDAGAPLDPATYSAVFDFVVGEKSLRAGTVIQIVAP